MPVAGARLDRQQTPPFVLGEPGGPRRARRNAAVEGASAEPLQWQLWPFSAVVILFALRIIIPVASE